MTTVDDRPNLQQLPLIALFLKFFRFGVVAFGGPVAQIAMIRQALVEDERWIDPSRFKRLLAVLQILPGPEAHELCVHLGMIARGRIGGLLAGLGFMLPGFVLMLATGWAYTRWISGNADLTRILWGVQVVVLAIILRAVVRIGQHMVEDGWLAAIAAVSLIATFAGIPFWLPLLVGGICYALLDRPLFASMAVALGVIAAVAMLHPIANYGIAPASSNAPATALALLITGLKGGLLTFGGAY
uniref:chromate transporter n=1 Tax=Sphingobium sp. TaxID=1912891 RepID=UPI003B3A12E7